MAHRSRRRYLGDTGAAAHVPRNRWRPRTCYRGGSRADAVTVAQAVVIEGGDGGACTTAGSSAKHRAMLVRQQRRQRARRQCRRHCPGPGAVVGALVRGVLRRRRDGYAHMEMDRTAAGAETTRPVGAACQAAQRMTGMPRVRALSTRFSVMPEPGKAMTPLGRRLSSSSLRRNGAARPWRSQSGLQTIWWTALRLAQLAAIFSTPGSMTSLPPAMATRVPWGRCACVLRSLRARTKSRASMAAEVRCPVWLPRRGRHVSPVSAR